MRKLLKYSSKVPKSRFLEKYSVTLLKYLGTCVVHAETTNSIFFLMHVQSVVQARVRAVCRHVTKPEEAAQRG